MKSFNRFLFLLATITDPRRAEGKLYKLQHVLLFSILAVVSGANSYRTIHTFIETHLRKLEKVFKIKWKKAPCYSEIRFVLQNLNPDDVEKAFREHAAMLNQRDDADAAYSIGIDGKTLRRSFDAMNDVKAKQVLNAFAADTLLVLAHIEIDEKSNEIPAAQKLFEELDLAGCIVTLDAMHCQKKPLKPQEKPVRI
jgi:hypothetical protein